MLEVQHLAGISLIKSYLMLENPRFADFNISELLRENQQGRRGCGGVKITPITQIRVKVKGVLYNYENNETLNVYSLI